MIEDLYAERKHIWQRYVASIPYAVMKYRTAEHHPSEAAVSKYEAGLWRYAKILENAATPRTKRER